MALHTDVTITDELREEAAWYGQLLASNYGMGVREDEVSPDAAKLFWDVIDWFFRDYGGQLTKLQHVWAEVESMLMNRDV